MFNLPSLFSPILRGARHVVRVLSYDALPQHKVNGLSLVPVWETRIYETYRALFIIKLRLSWAPLNSTNISQEATASLGVSEQTVAPHSVSLTHNGRSFCLAKDRGQQGYCLHQTPVRHTASLSQLVPLHSLVENTGTTFSTFPYRR